MRCEECREEISAQLDGEQAAQPAAAVQEHLDSCPDCRRWAQDAASVTRRARTELARPAPDFTERVLAAAPVRRGPRLELGLRIALVVIGACQLGLGLLQILGDDAAQHVVHFGHETASWNIALGVGFGWIGWRVTRAAGLVPTLTAFVAVLAVLSAIDLVRGHVDFGRLSTHSLVLLGYFVVLALAFRTRHRGDGFPYRARKSPKRRASQGEAEDPRQPGDDEGGTTRLRPAGHDRRAA